MVPAVSDAASEKTRLPADRRFDLSFGDPVFFNNAAVEQGRVRIVGGEVSRYRTSVAVGIAVKTMMGTGIVGADIDALSAAAFLPLIGILTGGGIGTGDPADEFPIDALGSRDTGFRQFRGKFAALSAGLQLYTLSRA